MPQLLAKVQDKSLGQETYACKHDWPEGSRLVVHESNNPKKRALDLFLQEEEGIEPSPATYSFIAIFPAPVNVVVRDFWNVGTGPQRPGLTASGHGGSFEAAEDKAWEQYQKILHCDHDFYRHHMSNHDRTPILDGDASCRHCNVYIHNYFMDEKLYQAKMIAYKVHEGVSRKYGNLPYIYHPQEVYMRVSWWKALPMPQRLLMASAAWLHDTVEDWDDPRRTFKTTQEEIIAEIREKCGDDVLKLVMELTNPSKGVKAPRRVRKQMDRDHLKVVSWEAKIIKLFDRICNLRDLGQCDDPHFLLLYAEESRQLLECLKDAVSPDDHLLVEFNSWVRHIEGRGHGQPAVQGEGI